VTQDIQKLIDEVNKIDPLLGNIFKSRMTNNAKLKSSAGEVTAANKILILLIQP